MTRDDGDELPVADYPPSVAGLVMLGPVPWARSSDAWPRYVDLGVRQEHTGDLIRLATDTSLYDDFCNDDIPETYAPLHACRALAQLQATTAAEPLVAVLGQGNQEAWIFEWRGVREWMDEEWPEIFGLLGPAAIPPLSRLLRDTSAESGARALAADCLARIAEREPGARAACLAPILEVFANYAENDRWLNAMLTFPLCTLKAREAAPVIEQAFAARRIESDMAWDLELIRYELGLADWPYSKE